MNRPFYHPPEPERPIYDPPPRWISWSVYLTVIAALVACLWR